MNSYRFMKKLLSAFVLLSVIHLKAQLFEWQMATHSGASIELNKKITVLKDESFTTVFSPEYRDFRSSEVQEMENYIDCANGTTVKFNPDHDESIVIANIAKNGTINWKQELFISSQRYEILHISSDEQLNSYILLDAYEIPDVNDYPLIYIPSGKLFYPVYSDEEAVDLVLTYDIAIDAYRNDNEGHKHKLDYDENSLGDYWLIKIDAKGKVRWVKNSWKTLDLLLSGAYCFESPGDGGFYFIAEDNSEPRFQKEIEKRKTKQQYLLARLDTGFTMTWSTKIISSSKKGDHSHFSTDPLLTLDENGNIIAYINYDEYIAIEDEEYTSKKRREGKNERKEGGSLIAVFDSAGKLKGVKNSRSAFCLKDMVARNHRIYLPVTNLRHNRLFNERIDTSGLLQSVLICLDYQGKLLWKKMDYNVQYKNIEISDNETLYLMTGPAKNRSNKKDHSEFHTPLFKGSHVKNANDSYIFMYDKTGAEIKMKTITEKRQWQYSFDFDFKIINQHYSLLFGEVSYGCLSELKNCTNNFKKGKGCDNVGFWCKLKL